MEILMWFICIVTAIVCFSRAMSAKIKERKEAELLERNPEAWKKAKEFEMEKKDRNRRAIGGAAITIARIILKK
jgi:hypothetical protein